MSILDPKWKYTPSTATDIRKTFRKARKEIKQCTEENSVLFPESLRRASHGKPKGTTGSLATSGTCEEYPVPASQSSVAGPRLPPSGFVRLSSISSNSSAPRTSVKGKTK